MATERQALVPGGGFVNERNTPDTIEAMVPGGGFLNETTEAAAGGGGRIMSSLAGFGGLAGKGGIAGAGGGLAG
tara:strand:+ start:4130 stop:4351 length:222 start_codon:yes stop_codon:yes gene_type:complete